MVRDKYCRADLEGVIRIENSECDACRLVHYKGVYFARRPLRKSSRPKSCQKKRCEGSVGGAEQGAKNKEYEARYDADGRHANRSHMENNCSCYGSTVSYI
jgi:hypothetical protein